MGAAGLDAPDRVGLFAPEEIFWQVNRETVLLLTGPRALLLQTAHPLVAAGVAEHSRFRQEPLARLRRTLDAMLTMIYAPRDEAQAAAAAVDAAHARVRGSLRQGTPRHPAGTPYSARDPDLARWVHATLVDSALVGFECFVRPLDPGERDRFVREGNRIAELLGVPSSHAFADATAFAEYLRETLEDGSLCVTEQGREVGESVLHPPLPLVPRFAGDAASLASVALLPEALRSAYGLPWGRGRQRAWHGLRALVRRTRPFWPAPLRVMPHARRAERHLQGAEAHLRGRS